MSSRDDMVVGRLATREMTAPTRNKAMVVMAAGVVARDQATTTRETSIIATSKARMKPSVGGSILN